MRNTRHKETVMTNDNPTKNHTDATPDEMGQVDKLRDLLRPGLRLNRKGRVPTSAGDKTMLGLYRTLAQFVDFTKAAN